MEQIQQRLVDRLRARQGQGAGSVEVVGDSVTVVVEAEQTDRYAVGVQRVVVRPAAGQPAVDTVARNIAEQVTALDQLQVIEVDGGEQRAILRSAQPDTDEAGVTYWEANVSPSETTLQRFRKDHQTADRQPQVEPIWYRDLGKVADQLANAVSPADE